MAEEVKSAALYTREAQDEGVIILVDENYEIHTVSGALKTLRLLLQDAELPNYRWFHFSGGRLYEAEGGQYKGRAVGQGISLLFKYSPSRNVA